MLPPRKLVKLGWLGLALGAAIFFASLFVESATGPRPYNEASFAAVFLSMAGGLIAAGGISLMVPSASLAKRGELGRAGKTAVFVLNVLVGLLALAILGVAWFLVWAAVG